MPVHLKTMHQPKTSALVYRPNAAHVVCVWTHKTPIGSSSGQAGRARAVEATPVGSKSLKQTVKQNQESTVACLANDIENCTVDPLVKSDCLLGRRCTVFDLCPYAVEKNPCGSQNIWRDNQARRLGTIKHRLLDNKDWIHTRQVLQLLFAGQSLPTHFSWQNRSLRVREIWVIVSFGLKDLSSSHVNICTGLQHV